MTPLRTLASVAVLSGCVGIAACGSTAATKTTTVTTSATTPATSATVSPPTREMVKRCLQEAGYNVIPDLGAHRKSPDADLTEIGLSGGPYASKGPIEAFVLSRPSIGIAAWFEVYESNTAARATVELVTRENEQSEQKGTENRERMERGGATLPPRPAAALQPQSAGDVAYVAWEGDPSSAIASCAGSSTRSRGTSAQPSQPPPVAKRTAPPTKTTPRLPLKRESARSSGKCQEALASGDIVRVTGRANCSEAHSVAEFYFAHGGESPEGGWICVTKSASRPLVAECSKYGTTATPVATVSIYSS